MTSHTAGRGLVSELKWVHGMIRRDLQTVRWLAADLGDGLPGGARRGSGSWRSAARSGSSRSTACSTAGSCTCTTTRVAPCCFRGCGSRPALGPVVDKLEADHARVSDLLDDVSAAAAWSSPAREEAGAQEAADPRARPTSATPARAPGLRGGEHLGHAAYLDELVIPGRRLGRAAPRARAGRPAASARSASDDRAARGRARGRRARASGRLLAGRSAARRPQRSTSSRYCSGSTGAAGRGSGSAS